MSKVKGSGGSRRLNRRAAIILGVGVLVVIPGFFAYKAYRERHNGALFLREAKAFLKQDAQRPLALQYLNRYLAMNPDDVDALDLKAQVLAEGARDSTQALEAIQVHNLVLGRDPDNPKRQETRRRLVELNLKAGGRAQAAETIARELIRRGANDAQRHRLLAEALGAVGGDRGDRKVLAEACREYEAAARLEPGDVRGAERLARLYRDQLNEASKAVAVLDRLVEANRNNPPKLAASHLARSRFFAATQPEKADAEVAQALKADPSDLEVCLTAAEGAVQHGNTAAAKRYLDAIPKEKRGDLRVKLVGGLIEFNEQRPDEAIASWRAGLLQTGGNNADLTWKLARVLISMGRVDEAEPLLSQYRRLVGGDEPNPLYRYLNGFALLKKDHPAEATAELEAIRYKIPRSLEPQLYDLLGQCYERVGDTAKASEAYRQATTADPRWTSSWAELAKLQGTAHIGDAKRILEQGLEVNPSDPQLLINLALVIWQEQVRLPREQRSWTRVEQLLDRAEKVAPHSLELALFRADYLATLGKTDEALKSLAAATDRYPKSAPLWLARANLLNRLGKTTEALAALDAAIAKSAQAEYFALRASLLFTLGHGKEARGALREGLDRVPHNQQAQVWKAVGELAEAQADMAEARHAYGEWARLRPDDAAPRAALLKLAMDAGDEAAIRADVDALQGVGGPQAPYWRLARAEELLRDHPGAAGAAKDAARLDEAERLIQEVEKLQPQSASGYMLEARLLEKRRQIDKAIAAYEKAIARKGGQVAAGPLMNLLVREHRDADLARIRRTLAGRSPELDRLATVQALNIGDKDRAEKLAALMVQGDPQGLDARVWQARVLNELGKPREAEATLRRLIAAHPGEPTPWVQLLMFQVSQKRFPEAAATIEQIRTEVKTDRPELFWAQCYRVVGDQARADECYREALRRRPDDMAVRSAAIAYYDQTGRRAEAEASLRYVLKHDPALGWATRRLALSLANHTGDRAAWNEALALIGPAAKSDDAPDDRLARAGVYAKGPEPKHRQEAIVILEELASELPNAASVQEPLARLLRDAGQLEKARAHAAKAAGENAPPDAILLYAGLSLAEKNFDEAERQAARLAKIDADNPAVAELHARIYTAQGKGKEAAAALERAFNAQASTPQALVVGEKMIGLLLQLKQPEAAERVARRVGTLGPKGACVLALFLAGQGKNDDALPLVEDAAKAGGQDDAIKAAVTLAHRPNADPRWLALADRLVAQGLKERPGTIDLLEKQARIRYLQQRYDDQVALFQQVLDRKPAGFGFLNDMAWTLSEDLNRPQDGLARADEALKRVGRDPNLLDTRGVILTRLGKLDDAIKDLEAAAEGMPVGAVYYHLARAYQKAGRQDAYRQARNAPNAPGSARSSFNPRSEPNGNR